MNRTAEEFRSQAQDRGIKFWKVHNCSMCGYECGFLFFMAGNAPEVVYDSGCDCTRSRTLRENTWEDVADHYSIQINQEVIARMNDFWDFKEEAEGKNETGI